MKVPRFASLTAILVYFCSFAVGIASALASSKLNKCVPNDDFCDCGDDEPTTSACSHSRASQPFTCLDSSHFVQRVFTSRIGDGVCDCCDGSDEMPGKCVNQCNEIADNLEEDRKRRLESKSEGIQKRNDMLKEASKQLQELKFSAMRAPSMTVEYKKQLDALKTELENELAQEQRDFEYLAENGMAIFKSAVLAALGREFTKEELVTLISALAIRGREESVEATLLECDDLFSLPGDEADDAEALALAMIHYTEYNGDESEVRLDGSNAAPVLETRKDSTTTQPLTLATVRSFAQSMAFGRLKDEALWTLLASVTLRAQSVSSKAVLSSLVDTGVFSPSQAGGLANTLANAAVTRETFSRSEVVEARSEIAAVEGKLSKLKDAAKEYNDVQKVVKDDPWLYALFGKCFSTRSAEYVYNVCFFGEARQSTTRLGTFAQTVEYLEPRSFRGIVDEPEKRVKVIFNRGERCFATKRDRDMEVLLKCSTETSLTDVREPEVCSYSAVLNTPLACFE